MSRREYGVRLTVNGLSICRVIIDPHYEVKHGASIGDMLVLRLVRTLDGERHEPVSVRQDFSYYVKDPTDSDGNTYRLVWLLEKGQDYVGVVNAYRR